MKNILITALFLFLTLTLKAQTGNNQDSTIDDFKSVVNKQFTKIATGTAFSNLGNFVSVSSDAKSFAIAGSLATKTKSVWGIELSGGATEGAYRLFNNEKLNSNFAGELKYHKLLKIHFAARNSLEVSDIENQISEQKNQFSRDSLSLVNQKELYKIQSDVINSESKVKEQNKHITKIDNLLSVVPIAKRTKDSLEAVRGTILFEIQNNNLNINILKKQLSKIEKDKEDYFSTELENKAQASDKKIRELKQKKLNLDLLGFDITWISFGLKLKNDDIKLFAPNSEYNKQFKDTSFVSQRFSASVSRYRSTSFQNQDVYWSAGVSFDYTTNFNSLAKVEIEERTPVPGNSQQEIRKTINAYQGNYKEGLFAFSLFYDYYRFFGKYNSIFGIHINPAFNYNETVKKPLTNILLGVVVPFGDKEKQTSKINVEIFYSRDDVFNYQNKEIKTSIFGIRATLPITIINNKL
ncbi:hypothetical protein [Flavobacterium salmonis]|uniref:Uncharacterized protein n=1 Tax=Flavobacterium salmonis TaxID=2654844 RepID=A0A6V6Z2W1_9FLAO|nr:hypothetical protein [Flavobacterium salmonis]CAD0006073.1 hypothetical protein FLAT13_03113 [Flavobacterium salmonis]